MTASLGSVNKAEQYVVSPGGGGKLAIGGIGFGTVFRELGNWNPELVECIFKASDKGGNEVATLVSFNSEPLHTGTFINTHAPMQLKN